MLATLFFVFIFLNPELLIKFIQMEFGIQILQYVMNLPCNNPTPPTNCSSRFALRMHPEIYEKLLILAQYNAMLGTEM